MSYPTIIEHDARVPKAASSETASGGLAGQNAPSAPPHPSRVV